MVLYTVYFVLLFIGTCVAITLLSLMQAEASGVSAFNPPSRFPKGHIREYDPSGEYTYKDQNPRYRDAS